MVTPADRATSTFTPQACFVRCAGRDLAPIRLFRKNASPLSEDNNLVLIEEFVALHPAVLQAGHDGGWRGHQRVAHGGAVQVGPIKPTLKPPGAKRLKRHCDVLLSTVAFKFNLRFYITETPLLDRLLDALGRGLHSSTFRLNVSALCEMGVHLGLFIGCFRRIFAGIRGCLGCILCQKRLKLSSTVDECKPLALGSTGVDATVHANAAEVLVGIARGAPSALVGCDS